MRSGCRRIISLCLLGATIRLGVPYAVAQQKPDNLEAHPDPLAPTSHERRFAFGITQTQCDLSDRKTTLGSCKRDIAQATLQSQAWDNRREQLPPLPEATYAMWRSILSNRIAADAAVISKLEQPRY